MYKKWVQKRKIRWYYKKKKKKLNYQFYDYLTFDGYFGFVLRDEDAWTDILKNDNRYTLLAPTPLKIRISRRDLEANLLKCSTRIELTYMCTTLLQSNNQESLHFYGNRRPFGRVLNSKLVFFYFFFLRALTTF